MANPPVEGDSADAAVAGITGTNSANQKLIAADAVANRPPPPGPGHHGAVFGPAPAGVFGKSTGHGGIGVAGSGVVGVSGTGVDTAGVVGLIGNWTPVVPGPVPSGIGVAGISQTGLGVVGYSESGVGTAGTSTADAGVMGESTSGTGVQAKSESGTGLEASSDTGVGVSGTSKYSTGVLGVADSDDGVAGVSQSGRGVHGRSDSGVGIEAESKTGNAVSASSTGDTDAIITTSSSPNHAALSGVNNSGGYGVWASSSNSGGKGGIGVYAHGAKFAGQFEGAVYIEGPLNTNCPPNSTYAINVQGGHSRFAGNVEVTGTHTVGGDVTVKGDVTLSGNDCAEEFEIAAAAADLDPGTVMVMTENGALHPSQDAYDKKVAGVISGAGDDKPGLILGGCQPSENRMPLALIGRVYCKADAQYGPIGVGDLLTTSPTAGHAMRAADPFKAFGAVIGKALQPLPSGQGLVRILVALQ